MGERRTGKHVGRVVDQVDLFGVPRPVDQLAKQLEEVRLSWNGQANIAVYVAKPLNRFTQRNRLTIALPVIGGEQEVSHPVRTRLLACRRLSGRLAQRSHEPLRARAAGAGSAILSESSISRSA